MPADPVTLATFGFFVLMLAVMVALRWWTFVRMPKPKGRLDEVVYTYGRRYKLTRRIKSPIDGRTMGWEGVDDYGNTRYFTASLDGVRRAG